MGYDMEGRKEEEGRLLIGSLGEEGGMHRRGGKGRRRGPRGGGPLRKMSCLWGVVDSPPPTCLLFGS